MFKLSKIVNISILLIAWLQQIGLTQDSVAQVVRRVKPAVVMITTYDASGEELGQASGFFIDSSHIITNWHVVRNASRAEVKTANGRMFQIRGIAALDTANDLVSLGLTTPNTSTRPLTIASTRPQEGERVVIISCPRGIEFMITEAIVSGVRYEEGEGNRLIFSAATSPGSSGGPVVNLRGEVVGVVEAIHRTAHEVNIAIPSEYIRALRYGTIVPLGTSVPAGTGRGPLISIRDPMSIGLELWQSENYSSALPYFLEAIRQNPQNEDAWYYAGFCYFVLEQYNNAAQASLQAVRLDPNDSLNWWLLGLSLDGLEEYDYSITALKQAVRLDPENPLIHFSLGLVYFYAGDRASALAEYNILRELDPEMAEELFGYIYQE